MDMGQIVNHPSGWIIKLYLYCHDSYCPGHVVIFFYLIQIEIPAPWIAQAGRHFWPQITIATIILLSIRNSV